MKSKKSTYLLITLTVIVWGLIVYRIFSHIHGSDDIIDAQYNLSDEMDLFADIDSIFALKLNYKDPFLKYSYTGRVTHQNSERKKPSTNIRQRASQRNKNNSTNIVNWPEIIFEGVIINDKTNELLGLLQINDRSHLLKPGDDANGVKLTELYSDSVRVEFQNEIKTIRK